MRRGGDVRHLLEPTQIFRTPVELIVANQDTIRRAAEGPVFLFVDFFELRALIEFDRASQIFPNFVFGRVQKAQLQRRARFRPADEVMQSAPGPFKTLKFLVLDHLIEILVDALIEFGNPLVAFDQFDLQLVDCLMGLEQAGQDLRQCRVHTQPILIAEM